MTGPTSRAENPAVVTIAHGRHAHLEHQRRHLAVVAPGVRHVVVAMDDPVLAQRCGPDVVAMPAGQIVGRCNAITPVADLIADLVSEYEEAVGRMNKTLGG